ncbi:agmatine deiminase family protein [Idiomarina seosinensis]|uniref:agmatine deiminase family protein n=1 Tax=Idiomarina seosinensis TaxID=281739 RepID=UPI003850AD27
MLRWFKDYSGEQVCLLAEPYRPEVWRADAGPALETIKQLQRVIARYQPCRMLTTAMACYDDIWLRDILPLWARLDIPAMDAKANNQLNWQGWLPSFDGWGAVQSSYQQDATLAKRLFTGVPLNVSSIIAEGGNFSHNGEWVLIGFSCLRERNPQLRTGELRQQLTEQLKPLKPVFIDTRLSADETHGHIDNMALFIADDIIVYAYTDNPQHPDFEACQQLHQQLQQLPPMIRKIALPLPLPRPATASERQRVKRIEGALARTEQLPLLLSYVNLIALAKVLIVPQYQIAEDLRVLEVLQTALPDYRLETFNARELVLGGGGLHCVTAQVPEALLPF